MPVQYMLSKMVENYQNRAMHFAFSFKTIVYKVLAILLVSSVILWLSVFLYVSFYYSYMPAVSHVKPVHLQFNPCHDEAGVCSYPSANVSLTRRKHVLTPGQPYRLSLDLEMPESLANQKLGMFMVQMRLLDHRDNVVAQSRRSGILHYKSFVLQLMHTVFYSPLLIAGPMEEKQSVSITLFSKFEEDPDHPVTSVNIIVESRWIEIYSANLRIDADFTGLRYVMFNWPVLSAILGIGSNVLFLSIVIFYSWYRLFSPHPVVVRVASVVPSTKPLDIDEKPSLSRSASAVQLTTPSSPLTPRSLEERRAEAKARLEKERQRKLSSTLAPPPLREEGPRRSLSVGSLSRIEEITPMPPVFGGEDFELKMKDAEDEEDAGVVLGFKPAPEPNDMAVALGMELRHRTSHQSPAEDISP